LLHSPCAGSALPADDHPVNPGEIYLAEILEKRFDRKKAYARRSFTKKIDTWQAILSVLDAYAEPDVRNARKPIKFAGQEIMHSLVPFSEHLICVPTRALHDSAYRGDIFSWHALLKKVAHRIDENSFWRPPPQRLVELPGNESEVKALLVWVAGHPSKAFGKGFSVTVLAARAYPGAAADGIPSGIGPLYGAFNCHCITTIGP